MKKPRNDIPSNAVVYRRNCVRFQSQSTRPTPKGKTKWQKYTTVAPYASTLPSAPGVAACSTALGTCPPKIAVSMPATSLTCGGMPSFGAMPRSAS